MAAADGRWNMEVQTPMGPQKGVLTVASDGDSFSGELSGDLGSMPIESGSVDGDTIHWVMEITKPMKMKVTCTATALGDLLDGKVDTGMFGAFALTGSRA